MKQTAKIMIIDDEPGILEVVKIILEGEGYQVFTINNSEEAIAKINLIKPNLIFLDVRMPGIGGEEICRQIKISHSTKEIPVILLSASFGTKQLVKKCGASDYLEKPFEMENIIKMVSNYLGTVN
jgi:CheY-like chemotaxis protein